MINLLPPTYKEELKKEGNFRLTVTLGILVLVFFICLSLLLLSIRIYVSGVINTERIFVEIEKKAYEQEKLPDINVKELNQNIGRLSVFYNEEVRISSIFEDVGGALPKGAYLKSFAYTPSASIGREGKTKANIALKGFAKTTEDLLALKVNLENNELFSNFFFPSANWVDPVDIDFSFSFELDI